MNMEVQFSKSPTIQSDVCRTAVVMAAKRAIETERPDRLFDDPFAAQLAGDAAINLQKEWLSKTQDSASLLKVQFVAVRTKYFDDFIMEVMSKIHQVVFLGAGLDTRAYRLSLPPETQLYEIDLPEIIDYKQEILKEIPPKCRHHTIATDLKQPWSHLLLQHGYQSNIPTVWLLEGLLMYLDETEVHQLLSTISELSPTGSYLGADLVSVKSWQIGSQNSKAVISGHWRFGTDEPEQLFATYGWETSVIQPGDLRANYGRYTVELAPREIPGKRRSYLVVGEKKEN
ncbi:class I SAM-dependent methyltransferase [Scytonema sp. PRP1]